MSSRLHARGMSHAPSERDEVAEAHPADELHRLVRLKNHASAQRSAVSVTLIGVLMADETQRTSFVLPDMYGHLVEARLAASCLIQAQEGDLVQAVVTHKGAWILNVLERAKPDTPLVMDFAAQTLQVHAQQLDVHTTSKLALTSKHLDMRASVMTQTADSRHSQVRGADSTRAGHSVMYTQGHLGMHAQSAVLTTDALLKIDAAQIHMG